VLVSSNIFPAFVFSLCFCWLYPLRIMNQYCEIRSIDSSFFFLTMACVICGTFQILVKNEVLTIFLTVFT
jgi:hypothetical protein